MTPQERRTAFIEAVQPGRWPTPQMHEDTYDESYDVTWRAGEWQVDACFFPDALEHPADAGEDGAWLAISVGRHHGDVLKVSIQRDQDWPPNALLAVRARLTEMAEAVVEAHALEGYFGPLRKICPRCGLDFTDWPGGDDEGVWSRDGKNYCSGECVIRAWRSNLPSRLPS